MITIPKHGRLGNAMFRNCAASILSEKFDIKVKSYLNCAELKILNPKFYNKGTKVYDNQIEVVYKNLTNILQKNDIDYGLYLKCPCQKKNFVLNYKNKILSQFDPQYNLEHKNDLFVHVRLGDILQFPERILSLDYYTKAIERIKFEKGYISSDTPHHEIVTYLINRFNLTLYQNKPAETINFAKDFGSLVLSGGTFSWWIAFLSKTKSVFYPRGGPKWFGNIFVFDEWTPIKFK